jgi:NAD(P)-dependent dehydrogenase (short-subunit alcohol dehydrogenase family)
MTAAVDFEGGGVVVTGGTRGLGKALGMELSRAGATVFLTHRWGSADEDELRAEFTGEGLPAPRIIESDVSDPDAARALMREVAAHRVRLVAMISNVAFAAVVSDVRDLTRSSLELSLRYSTWPVLEYVHAARETLGYHPRYVLAISTDGGEICHPGYDMVGVAKAGLEALCRYLALRLRSEGVRVNVVRCAALDTVSSRATFGDAVIDSDVVRRLGLLIEPRAVARACVALCSGLMDSVTGQVITVDEGISLVGPLAYLTQQGWPAPMPRPEPEVGA